MTDALVHAYTPRGAARELYHCRDDEVLIAGPAGTGKSVACLHKVMMACLLVPGCKTLVLRKTLTSLGASALDLWRKHVAAEIIANGTTWFFGGNKEDPAQYKFLNGSMMVVGGLDKPSKIMSTDYDLIYVCEATELTLDDWEMMTTRLRSGNLRFQQLLADCNPAADSHWLYQRCLAGRTTLLRSVHTDNPVLVDDNGQETETGRAYLDKLRGLSGFRRARLLDGKWVGAEGIIFEEWSEAGPGANLVDRFYVPRSWPRYLVIDFGYRNPFVAQWWATNTDGQLFMYREIYFTGRRVEEHCQRILELHRRGNEPWFTAIICDHDAEDAATVEHCLQSATVKAKKGVTVGIDLVKSRLVANELGRPGLVIIRDSTDERDPALYPAKPASTVEEFGGYVWLPASGDRAAKEEPRKENDHGCLIAGTAVSTSVGPVAIELVRPGDLVLTRVGPRVVLASGMTSERAAVYRVELSTGEALTGTGNHPVWVDGEGWKRLDAVRYMDRLMVCQTANPNASTGSSSAATQTPRTGLIASTTRRALPTGSAASAAYTRRSGSRRMAPSLRGARSTTPTTTPATTNWATSSVSPLLSTRKHTASEGANGQGHPSIEPILSGLGPLLPNGTVLMKGGPGTASTPRSTSLATPSRGPGSVNSVATLTRRLSPVVGIGFAPTGARAHGDGRAASTTSSARAPIAAPSSPLTVTALSVAVGAHVLSVSALPGRVPVFNLTVADQAEFFAQGVLVHNCDALRYMVAHLDWPVSGEPEVVGVRRPAARA